jgi:hypothetical protein
LGISLWIALATVIPGLVTIAVIFGAIFIITPEILVQDLKIIPFANDWVWAGLAITTMILTQALGILLEGILVSRRWLGPETREIKIPEGIDPHGETKINLKPYFEYQGLYILLAELREDEDTQGHLKRALAQFFLTNNTLVSFTIGIIVGFSIIIIGPGIRINTILKAVIYAIALGSFLLVSYKVAIIRFEVMAKALWAARRRRSMCKNNDNKR